MRTVVSQSQICIHFPVNGISCDLWNSTLIFSVELCMWLSGSVT